MLRLRRKGAFVCPYCHIPVHTWSGFWEDRLFPYRSVATFGLTEVV
jgi:hypothetical protein